MRLGHQVILMPFFLLSYLENMVQIAKKDTNYTLKQLAMQCGAEVAGDENTIVKLLCPSNEPNSEGLAFIQGAQVRDNIAKKFAAVITTKQNFEKINRSQPNGLIVKDPFKGIIALLPLFYDEMDFHFTSDFYEKNQGSKPTIASDCTIGKECIIYPSAVIYPHVTIGDRTIIHSGVVIREGTVIGSDCVIHPNAVIGTDGFGYVPDPQLGLVSIPQVGNVEIGNRVHIGASSCIDRATLGSTVIGDGTKIDNQVQVGHNVKIGKYVILCAQVGIAGSCIIEDRVVLGGKVGVVDHCRIIAGARVAGGSIVWSDIDKACDWSGIPALPAGEYRRNTAMTARLFKIISELKSRILSLEKK